MKKIKGLVFVVTMVRLANKPLDQHMLFGPSVHNRPFLFENVESNGMEVFSKLPEARRAMKSFLGQKRAGVLEIQLAQLTIAIAETEEDLKLLRSSRKLIVIVYEEAKQVALVGRLVEGRHEGGVLPGSRLRYNGLKSIPSMDRALQVAQERKRQCDCGVRIASFDLLSF